MEPGHKSGGMAAMAPLSSPTATHFRFLQPHAVTPSTAASREVRLKRLPVCTATASWLHWPIKREPLPRVFRAQAVCCPREEPAWRKETRGLHVLGFHPFLVAPEQQRSFHL